MKSKRIGRIPTKYQKAVESELHQLSFTIQKKREKMGVSQETLAEKLGIGVTTLQAIENGRRYPSLPMFFYVCMALGIKVEIE